MTPSRIPPGMPKLIGFTGKAGVGKTTMANNFVHMFGYKKLAYADPLKEALAALTGDPLSTYNDQDKKHETTCFGFTRRRLMQMFGTEFVREKISEEFWTWRMNDRLRALTRDEPSVGVVIDDVRFDNEAELIRSRDGVIVHLQSPENGSPGAVELEHRSERGVEVLTSDYVAKWISGPERAFIMLSFRILESYGVIVTTR